MKCIAWSFVLISEILFIGALIVVPNRFYNEPTAIAQYAGYARGVAPLLPIPTMAVLGFDLFRAAKKRIRLKGYCPIRSIKGFESVPLYRFLDVAEEDLEKAIAEFHLLQERGIPCDNHVVKVLRGFFDES